jgi:site-specific DNA-methyltransferase (adenine-specific)
MSLAHNLEPTMPTPQTPPSSPVFARASFGFRQQTALPFLRSLAPGSVDLALTDPPYLISRESGFKNVVHGEKRLGINTHFGTWDTAEAFSLTDLGEAIAEIARVLRPGGTAIVFFDLWKITPLREMLEASGFSKVRLIEWIKTNPVPVNSNRLSLERP